jgi:hypothetical protein
MCDDIMVQYKEYHFLLSDDIFVISFSDLYDLCTIAVLDISLMPCFALYVRKN